MKMQFFKMKLRFLPSMIKDEYRIKFFFYFYYAARIMKNTYTYFLQSLFLFFYCKSGNKIFILMNNSTADYCIIRLKAS